MKMLHGIMSSTQELTSALGFFMSDKRPNEYKAGERRPNSAGGLRSSSKLNLELLEDSDLISEKREDAMYNYHMDRATFNEDGVYWAHKMATRRLRLGASERDYVDGSRNSLAKNSDEMPVLSLAEKMSAIHGTAGFWV